MNEIQGNWTLKEIRHSDGTTYKFDEHYVDLDISKDRFYRTQIAYNKEPKDKTGAEAHIDTFYDGYDYTIKGHQLKLKNVLYLPRRLKYSVSNVIYEDSIFIKVERGKSLVHVKRLGPEEMICSFDDMESVNHVYRRINTHKKISTQQDVRTHYLKQLKDWH